MPSHTFDDLVFAVRRWFLIHQIPLDKITLILNFQDQNAAARTDAVLQRELADHALRASPLGLLDVRDFKVQGLRIKIESPLHPPLGDAPKYEYYEFPRMKGEGQ